MNNDFFSFLQYFFNAFKTGIKIILVDEIESLNLNAVNAILKIIEEPTPNTYNIDGNTHLNV